MARADSDPLWLAYQQALADPGWLGNQQQLLAFVIEQDNLFLKSSSRDRLRAEVTARLLQLRAASPNATPRAVLLQQEDPVPGLAAFPDGRPLAEGSWKLTKSTCGSTSDAAYDKPGGGEVRTARCSAGSFSITFEHELDDGQGAPWRLRADGSQATVFRAPWQQLPQPIGFTAGAQGPPKAGIPGRPTPCVAAADLPLDGARRLIRISGTGRRGFDGERRTWQFDRRKDPRRFVVPLEPQETEGVQGQVLAHSFRQVPRGVQLHTGACVASARGGRAGGAGCSHCR
ncbi:hypothetical protein ABPG77_001681 [Micractinium sp. CCAP 211/92]